MPMQRAGEPVSPGVIVEEAVPATVLVTAASPRTGRGHATTFTRNSAISVGRLAISTLVSLVLPAYLTHRLPVRVYSAWVLILQMSAYVGYLDVGIQTGISKYVAEHEAKGDRHGASQRATAGLTIMVVASLLGMILTLLLAWRVPQLFSEMPAALFHDVRLSLIFVGVSLSFGLLCSVTAAIFLGLQRYGVPTVITLLNRVLYTAVIVLAVLRQSTLATMGALVALVNVGTGILQVAAWRKLASHVRLSLRALDRNIIRQMLSYCSVLAFWYAGMLCVSGLDLTIVGRYDYGQTAFYSIATLPTNFLISMIGAALGPLLPTASALSAQRSSLAMGALLARITRYSVALLCLAGVPLLVGGYWILRIWVGTDYAVHTVGYLRVLVLANMIRNIGLPYATMLVATGRQKVGTAAVFAEAVVNLGASVLLARRMGAAGVALGTLLGAVVSVAIHIIVSMQYTQENFRIGRLQFLAAGILRPAGIALPTLLFLPWWRFSEAPRFASYWLGIWAVSTCLIAWFGGLNEAERSRLLRGLRSSPIFVQ